MAETISKTKLIDFQDLEVAEEEKACHKEAFNSTLLKMSELEKYKEVSRFTYCENEKCQMILTEHVAVASCRTPTMSTGGMWSPRTSTSSRTGGTATSSRRTPSSTCCGTAGSATKGTWYPRSN